MLFFDELSSTEIMFDYVIKKINDIRLVILSLT